MAGQQPPKTRSTPPQKQAALKAYKLPVSWDVPQDLLIPSATNIIVQRDGQDFIVNIFELRPPLLLGTDEEKLAQLQKMDAVHAKCIARFLVAADRMPEFIKALTDAQELPAERFVKTEVADAND